MIRGRSQHHTCVLIIKPSLSTHPPILQTELQIPVNQALALFVKSIRKICKRLQDIHREAIGSTIPHAEAVVARGDGAEDWAELQQPLADELEEAAMEVTEGMKQTQKKAMMESLDVSK